MYGLKVSGGDLAVRGDGNVSEVRGADRIVQELSHWLLEPLGTDTLYERFGSTLDSMIGSPMLPEYISEVRSEVGRVVSNYVEYQKRMMREDRQRGEVTFMRNWPDDEIIDTVDGVSVTNVADRLLVTVKLTTVAGARVSVIRSV